LANAEQLQHQQVSTVDLAVELSLFARLAQSHCLSLAVDQLTVASAADETEQPLRLADHQVTANLRVELLALVVSQHLAALRVAVASLAVVST
jgi:hypothetical protein